MAFKAEEPNATEMFPVENQTGSSGKLEKTRLNKNELMEIVANILDDMINEASKNYYTISQIAQKTKFHAEKKPEISVKDYLFRFGNFSNCDENAFIAALIYLDKIGENNHEFELDSFNVHRYFVFCLSYLNFLQG